MVVVSPRSDGPGSLQGSLREGEVLTHCGSPRREEFDDQPAGRKVCERTGRSHSVRHEGKLAGVDWDKSIANNSEKQCACCRFRDDWGQRVQGRRRVVWVF